MSLSRQSVGALMDLIENKLSCMTVSDRDDLREKVTLQRALSELSSVGGMSSLDTLHMSEVPRRGRRRRIMQEGFA
jgi:hypothetical protein